jgi:hypothetical protein
LRQIPWAVLLAACSSSPEPLVLPITAAGAPPTVTVGEAVPGEPLLVTIDGLPAGAVVEAGVSIGQTSTCRLRLAGVCSQLRTSAVTGTAPVIGGVAEVALQIPEAVLPGTTLYVQVGGRAGNQSGRSPLVERLIPDVPVSTAGTCEQVQNLMDGACISCHGEAALANLDLRDVAQSIGAPSSQSALPLLDAGSREDSYLFRKIAGTHLAVGAGGQMPPGGPYFDPDGLEIVGSWIDAGADCGGAPPDSGMDTDPPPVLPTVSVDPNQLDQDALFVCDGGPSSSQARLRRIDRQEWRKSNALKSISPGEANPFDPPASLQYSTYAEDVTLDATTLDLYLDVVSYAGNGWETRWSTTGHLNRPNWDGSLQCMWNDAVPDASCIDNWLRIYFYNGATFREPTAAELAAATALTVEAIGEEATLGRTRDETLLYVTSGIWLTSSALFRSEMGEGTADAYGRKRLSNEEIGRLVAMMVSDFAPGAQGIRRNGQGPPAHPDYMAPLEGYHPEIRAAVEDGTIQQPGVIAALLRSHAAAVDPERYDMRHDFDDRWSPARSQYWMNDKLVRFFLEWLEVTDFPTKFKEDPAETSQFEADPNLGHIELAYANLQNGRTGYEPSGLEALADTIGRIVIEDSQVLDTLLTTRRWYLPSTVNGTPNEVWATANTQRAFNLTGDVGPDRVDRWVDLPVDERAGVLTHPAWLAAHGDAFEDGPSLVLRGKWVRENLFCERVPPLELVMVEAQLIESDGTLTARERVEQSTENRAECMACHQYMNELGKPFELYNHAGFSRLTDHGSPPDGSAVLTNAPDPALNRAYTSAPDFMEALGDSEHVKRCFIRQSFRFFAGRDETPADACVLSEMETAYDANDGSFLSMLEALATSDTLLYRHVSEEGMP